MPKVSTRRAPLVDRTNIFFDPNDTNGKHAVAKRPFDSSWDVENEAPERTDIDMKVVDTADNVKNIIQEPLDVEMDDSMPVSRRPPMRRGVLPVHGLLTAARSGGRVLPQHLPSDLILSSLVTSHKTDVFRFPSTSDQRPHAPPFGVAFSQEARNGGKMLLATATEEGTVELVDAASRDPWDPLPQRTTLQPHTNAIFSLAFSNDDRLIATTSGDRTAVVTDLSKRQSLCTLAGHTGSVKCVAWDSHNPNMLSTGARDGRIAIWDLRVGSPTRSNSGSDSVRAPIATIENAHAPRHTPTKKRSPKMKFAPNQSVTALVWAQHRDNGLFSAGNSDGVLKLWDVRKLSRKGGCVEESPDPTILPTPLSALNPNNASKTMRSRGITSLALGGAGDRIFALGTDSRIHSYTPLSLSLPCGPSLTHPSFAANSFYIKIASSPCGRFLASGSSSGNVFVWDVWNTDRSQRVMELRAHDKECGNVSWAEGAVASAGDDGAVRVWRMSPGTVARCKEHGEEEKWNWSWAV